jgi:hypothetical protein
MNCNLCRSSATLRRDGTYASHRGPDGEPCAAVGRNTDEAQAMRRCFTDRADALSRLYVFFDDASVGLRIANRYPQVATDVWVTLSAASARRLAVELLEMADALSPPLK